MGNPSMVFIRLWERQRFTGITCQPLAKRVVPTFDMVGLPRVFADATVRFFRGHFLISAPKIAVAVGFFIALRDGGPKRLAAFFTAVTDDIGDNLPGSAAERNPTNAYCRGVWQMTRLHPIPIRHGLWRAIRCLRVQGSKGLFFLTTLPKSGGLRWKSGKCPSC